MLPVDPGYRPVTAPTAATAAPPAELSPAQQQALAVRYAPVLYFHPDEKNFLQDPNTFLEQSSLREERDFRGDKELYPEGAVLPESLANIGPENATADGQKFLDHSDSDTARAGDLPNSRNLYQFDTDGETSSITYFLFYSYNDGPPGGVGEAQNHEGDWERVTVQLDANLQPTEVRYSAHEGSNTTRAWSDVHTEDGRPVVYVGKGSHASYAEPGTWDTDLPGVHDFSSDDGVRFDLGGQPAVDVTTQSWYGSHVLWGERGTSSEIPSGVPWLGSASGITSGPTGPSREKGPVGEGTDRQPISAEESPPQDPGFTLPFPLPSLPDLPDLPSLPSLPRIDLLHVDLPGPHDIDIPDFLDPRKIDLPGPL